MPTYLISYDLNLPEQNYEDLHAAIKEIANGWWHHLDSTWIIKHPGSAATIRNILKSHTDKNDELLVVKLSNEGAWQGFGEKGSNWLKQHLS